MTDFSRRRLLAATGATLSTAGCLGSGLTDPPQGTIGVGETTRRPATDGSLDPVEDDWPAPHFDARNRAYNPSLDEVLSGPAQVEWHRQLVTEEDDLSGAPAIRDGSAFVTTERELVVLDARTGADQWTVVLDNDGMTGPTVTDRFVYVGAAAGVVAVDRDTQSVAWVGKPDRGGLPDSYHISSGAPTVANGIVVLGTRPGTMNAFDAITGERLWTDTVTRLPDESGTPSVGNRPFFEGPVAIADERVYAANNNGSLYAWDLATGEREWTVRLTDGSFEACPTVVDGHVYGVWQELSAIDARSGDVRWRYGKDPGSMAESAVVTDDAIYVGAGESFGSITVTALTRDDRSVDWETGGRPQNGFSVGPKHHYVPLGGELVAIERATGDVAWTMTTESVISGPPALTEAGIVVADERGAVYGIGPAT